MEFAHLKRWSRPQCYMGAEWHNWYGSGVGQTRDSSALDRANFDAMWRELSKLPDVDIDGEAGLRVVRESHWACGWVEWIAIHESNSAALELADSIMAKMEGYPVIDEKLFSQYEDEECAQVWETCYNERERAVYLRKHCGEISPLSGESVYRTLRAAIKGSWYHAANILPDPSALIA